MKKTASKNPKNIGLDNKNLIPVVSKIVIGDVGSGKTIVALITGFAYLTGLKSGQVCLIAPTEILANQHYKALENFLEMQAKDFDVKLITTILLTSKNIIINGVKVTASEWKNLQDETAKNHNKVLEKIGVESIKSLFKKVFWVGTHALLFQEIVKPNLVLADEQHRFGVNQRKKLSQDMGENLAAHYISFTATPIPRTLALTAFGKLEPIFLEKLETRSPIKTQILMDKFFKEKGVGIIKKHVELGRKVFVICPKVEDDNEELWSVKKMKDMLEKEFSGKVLLTHGKEKEKGKTMQEFRDSKDKQILVATTVVEVGVDVGEATLCVVMNAEMFGLSTLHQIRGRVGRNDYEENECVLVCANNPRNARLQALVESQDGFYLAQKDMENRGSGDMFGTMQSGQGVGDSLLNLDPETLEKLEDIVRKTDVNAPELTRLKNYLDKKAADVWRE